MADTTVAIIGAGIGGIYLAAELGTLGCRAAPDRSRRQPARRYPRPRRDRCRGAGGFAAIERVTTDLAAAVDGADVIAVCTGGKYQEGVARGLAPLLRDGQTILLIQGNTGGALVFRRALDAAGCRAAVDIAEMDNYPYSCWRLGADSDPADRRKKCLQIAAFPGNRIDAGVRPARRRCFPHAVAAPTSLSTGFTNANAMLHVANCVANAGKIDRGESYKFYAEGVTPAVARLYQAINAERVAVAAALGAEVPTLEDWFERTYGVRGATLVGDLPAADHQQRRPLSGDRHAAVLGPQIHRRGRAGRADADARAGPGRRRADAGDRRRDQPGANPGRHRFRRTGAHPRPHGPRRHGRAAIRRTLEEGFR